MDRGLARDLGRRLTEINKKLQEGETAKAAEKASELRERLTEAQQKDRWSGDATVMALVDQLAASG
jgi:hypothetical protein